MTEDEAIDERAKQSAEIADAELALVDAQAERTAQTLAAFTVLMSRTPPSDHGDGGDPFDEQFYGGSR